MISYDRAVGRQSLRRADTLGWMPLIDWGWKAPLRLPETAATKNFWNAGVNMAYGGRDRIYSTPSKSYPSGGSTARYGGDTQLKQKPRRRSWLFGASPEVSPTNYDRASIYMQYGDQAAAKHELGDLFNDIMGAVVPNWDQRPAALKNLQLKVDPAKALAAVQKIAPGAGGQAVQAANAAGLNVYANTPAGKVLITPEMAQGAYKNYPMYTEAMETVGDVASSPMLWLAMGGIGLGLWLMLKR